MESFRDDKLAATLSALRPAPRPAFAAELDERAAAGFPRPTTGSSQLTRAVARLRGISPRRALLPLGAAALAALAVATVIAVSESEGGGSHQMAVVPNDTATVQTPRFAPHQTGATNEKFEGGDFDGAGHSGSSGESAASSGGSTEHATSEDNLVPFSSEAKLIPFSRDGTPANFDGSGPYAAGSLHRDVERSAEMVLGADPAEVSDDAAKVFAAVHSAGGIVLNSSVHDGSGEFAPGAHFELLIPSAKLGDALGAFSQIAEVRYRREATNDITAPTVGVSERLQDSNAKVESLLAQLAAAESDGEREAVEVELATERRHAASLRSQLTALQRRANFSRVSLQIKTGESSTPSSVDSDWSLGDALHDAGHILAIAAGVAIVGLAIVGPLALIALLIWFANRAWVHRSRHRALG
jgi:hypothetical protein